MFWRNGRKLRNSYCNDTQNFSYKYVSIAQYNTQQQFPCLPQSCVRALLFLLSYLLLLYSISSVSTWYQSISARSKQISLPLQAKTEEETFAFLSDPTTTRKEPEPIRNSGRESFSSIWLERSSKEDPIVNTPPDLRTHFRAPLMKQ